VKQIVFVAIAMGLMASACGDSTPSGSGNTAGAQAALADSDVPVPADFEEDAEKNISASNYKSEIDTLEKEVDSSN